MSLLVGLISFVVLAIVVPIVIRVRPQRNAIGTIIFLAIVIHAAGTVLGAILLPELDYWQNAAPCGFFTIILLYAYGTCYRSLSVQMLVAIARSAPQAIEVQSLYDVHFRSFIRSRIDALIEGGRAEFRDGGLAITAAGRSDAARLVWARRAFGLKENRLYFEKKSPTKPG